MGRKMLAKKHRAELELVPEATAKHVGDLHLKPEVTRLQGPTDDANSMKKTRKEQQMVWLPCRRDCPGHKNKIRLS